MHINLFNDSEVKSFITSTLKLLQALKVKKSGFL